ncbi:DUF427 domain-containing protein [Paenibacillus sp. MMO-177]|uniref:DUF427 domain-containing protein n=1 Tax=Paenibacillus sp. MMO-177 TaxID=3081289 RepID=UPI00301900D4
MDNQESSLCEIPMVKERSIDFVRISRKVRVKFGGVIVAESDNVILVREENVVPVYYLPYEDIDFSLLERTDRSSACAIKGQASYWHIRVDGAVADNAMWAYENPIPKSDFLKGYASFYWRKVEFYEEEERVFGFPRDPYVRVDALNSSRSVKVVVEGNIIAQSERPVVVYETGMTPRYYLPLEDVRVELLEIGQTSYSPYIGQSRQWAIHVSGKEKRKIAWSYEDPSPELGKLKGRIGFYQEAADEFYVDELRWEPREGELLYLKGI